jgi:hypothetical protein
MVLDLLREAALGTYVAARCGARLRQSPETEDVDPVLFDEEDVALSTW